MTNGSGIPPIQPGTARPSPVQGQVVQIVSLPDALKNNARSLRIEGEVVQQNKDGTTRIKTSEGLIDIAARGRQPQAGQKIELEIPAGTPPRQATIRPAPVQVQTPAAPPPSSTPVTAQTPATDAPESVTTTAPRPTPPPSYQPPPATQGAAPAPMPQPLTPGQQVRLTTLPPAQAQAMILQSLTALAENADPATALPAQVARAAFQAGFVARAAPDELQKSLVQTITTPKNALAQTPVTGTAPKPQTGMTPPQIPAPATIMTGGNTAPMPDMPDGLLLKTLIQPGPSLAVTAPQTGSTMPAPLPLEVGIVQLLRAGLIAHSAIETQIQAKDAAPRLFQLDLKILDIKPPGVQILPAPSGDGMTSIKSGGLPPVPQLSQGLAALQPSLQAAPAAPAVLSGIVTGFTPQRLPIVTLQWPGGALSQNFVLQFAASDLSPGSRIMFQPPAPSITAGGAAQTSFPILPLMQAGTIWPALDDMYQTLLQLAPQAAQSMARTVPSPGNPGHMGSAALLFISALRAGDIGGWLGDKKLDAITRSGKDSLLSRLSQDIGGAARANADAPSGEWRSYPVPMLWQNEIAKVMLHIKHEQGSGDREDGEDSTRFIMDLALTRMGDVQLDGMVRGKRLDLVVRTQMPVSLPMQDAMRKAYADALSHSDVYGDITFQGDFKHWVQVFKREGRVTASA